MKAILNTLFLVFTFTLFTGCDELITKNVDVPISFTLFNEIDIEKAPEPKWVKEFNIFGEYDLLSHPDISEAIGTPDKIKKAKITKIQYEFKNFSGNVDAVLEGDVFLAQHNSVYLIPKVNVSKAYLFKELYNLNGDFDYVNYVLSRDSFFRYTFNGTSSHNPVNVYFVLNVSATITVEASIDWQGNFK